jgi:hypothetical protein
MKASRGMGAVRPSKLPDASESAVLLKKGGKAGLYANIHAKQERIKAGSNEKMRKPGAKGAPTKADFVKSAKTARKK